MAKSNSNALVTEAAAPENVTRPVSSLLLDAIGNVDLSLLRLGYIDSFVGSMWEAMSYEDEEDARDLAAIQALAHELRDHINAARNAIEAARRMGSEVIHG
jgi:hypothetical protein